MLVTFCTLERPDRGRALLSQDRFDFVTLCLWCCAPLWAVSAEDLRRWPDGWLWSQWGGALFKGAAPLRSGSLRLVVVWWASKPNLKTYLSVSAPPFWGMQRLMALHSLPTSLIRFLLRLESQFLAADWGSLDAEHGWDGSTLK